MNVDSNNPQSYYNEGFFQIQRLNMLKTDANRYSTAGNYARWRWVLDTIWRELSVDILKQESMQDEKEIQWYKNNYYYQMYMKHQEQLRLSKFDKEKYYFALSDYEMFLRYLQDMFGKGGKYVDPDDNGID